MKEDPVIRPRNVILFLTDQQRLDSIGAYGNSVASTPNLDWIASRGVRYTRAYTHTPWCSPARTSILTGTYLRTHGVWHNGIQFLTGVPTIANMLGTCGYRTGSVGKVHVNPWFGAAPPAAFEESDGYWASHPEIADWHGPYLGFQEVDLVHGHGHYSMTSGHYAAYLDRCFPDGKDLLKRPAALFDLGYRECWKNAIPERHHYNAWIADRTIEMIDRFGSDPFFIHCSFPDPHHPFTACEPYASMFDPDDMPDPLPYSETQLGQLPPHYLKQHHGIPSFDKRPPDFPNEIAGTPLRHIMAQTYGMVSHVDACIGRILEHLRRSGRLDETLIIFTTDHGELLGDHGFIYKGPFCYQCLMNVPLLAMGPGVSAGVRSDLVCHVDILPSILAQLGLAVPSHATGRPLPGLLPPDWAYFPRDAVLSEFRPRPAFSMKILHTARYRYVFYHGQSYGELFDLLEDPGETTNRFDDGDYARVRKELHERLLMELAATESPWPEQSEEWS